MSTPTPPRTFPVACPCGWTGAPTKTKGNAAWIVRRHQRSTLCTLEGEPAPVYVCTDCAVEHTPEPNARCETCRKADVDSESPLKLGGGRWVPRRGIRVFVPHTAPRRSQGAAA